MLFRSLRRRAPDASTEQEYEMLNGRVSRTSLDAEQEDPEDWRNSVGQEL